MAKLDSVQTAIMKATIQATTVAEMALKEADRRHVTGTSLANAGDVYRPRHGRSALRQPPFEKEKALNKYVELLNFEMKVMNILETKAYGLNDEDKVPIIKTG